MRNTFANDALSGRKALIFAASRGIGKAVAEKLATMGADLVILARSEADLKQVAGDIQTQTQRSVQIEAVDLLDETALRQTLQRHLDTDIIVTNCGGPTVAPFSSIGLDLWDDAYRMIVRSVVIACQELVPAMAERGWGRVVMLTSSTVVDPLRHFSLSNSLRKALLGLAQSLTQEYAAYGVSANLVCPGLTRTNRLEALITNAMNISGQDQSVVLQRMIQPIAAKRLAEPTEIAAAVAFLCSEEAGFIQAQALVVDGGQSTNP